MSDAPYIVRNDYTGRAWPVYASEARLYTNNKALAAHYSVFRTHSNGLPLSSFDIY